MESITINYEIKNILISKERYDVKIKSYELWFSQTGIPDGSYIDKIEYGKYLPNPPKIEDKNNVLIDNPILTNDYYKNFILNNENDNILASVAKYIGGE